MSPSACHRRIRALETRGLIAGYAARVDPRALGLAIVMRKAFAHGTVLDAVDDNGEPVGRVRVVTTTWPRAFEVAADGVGA